MSRYVVRETEGYLTGKPTSRIGLSVYVMDTSYNYRVVGTWRTEDLPAQIPPERRRSEVRQRADEYAAALNAEEGNDDAA